MVTALATAGLLDQYGVDGNITNGCYLWDCYEQLNHLRCKNDEDALLSTKFGPAQREQSWPVQIRPEQHRGRNSGSDEGGEYRINPVEEEIVIRLRMMTYCSVGWSLLFVNPYCPDEPVVVDHQAGWMIWRGNKRAEAKICKTSL